MAEEIIDYIKSLKKGFDKDLFQSKVDELGYIVDSSSLKYEDFHTLFKIWLNLSIPITKWVSLGTCLVPHENIKQHTIDYSLRWILANYKNQNIFSRISFLLDWLTAAMECDSIDIQALDSGYELFYTMLTCEVLMGHAMKLVYTLTKPADVTRRRVLEIIKNAKTRESKKSMYKQLQILLGLFKSYKPECVPENIPSISIHTAFKKINNTLLTRFKNSQNNRIAESKESQRLFWTNPINSDAGKNKKADPLVPNMKFLNTGAKQYVDSIPQKTYHDFSDGASLLQYSLGRRLARPARLRALLLNDAGTTLLAAAPRLEHAFLSHDLNHLLTNCFLEISPHSYVEKQDLLLRLANFQSTLMQGLPVVTRFLAQFLPFWNEKDFFFEILELVEWVNVQETGHIHVILNTISKIYHRSAPLEQCAILKTMTTMYTNLAYGRTRGRCYFLSMNPSEENFDMVLSMVSSQISDVCNKALQTSPDDMRVVHSCARACAAGARAGAGAQLLSLAIPLLAPSALALDYVAAVILSYKQILSALKAKNGRNDPVYVSQVQIMKAITADFVGCFCEEFLSGRKKGIVFSKLHPQLVSKLSDLIPDVDSKLSIRNHLAFAPYTYMELMAIDYYDADNRLWFKTVIDKEKQFRNLSQFVKEAMPEMFT